MARSHFLTQFLPHLLQLFATLHIMDYAELIVTTTQCSRPDTGTLLSSLNEQLKWNTVTSPSLRTNEIPIF